MPYWKNIHQFKNQGKTKIVVSSYVKKNLPLKIRSHRDVINDKEKLLSTDLLFYDKCNKLLGVLPRPTKDLRWLFEKLTKGVSSDFS